MPSKPCRKVKKQTDVFYGLTIAAAILALVFVGSAVVAIVGAGVSHFGEAVTNEEVLFSLRMSFVTSTISSGICLVLALPTAYALTRTNMPCKKLAEVVMELTLSLPYILLGFALLLVFSSPFGKALKEWGFAVVFQPTGIVFAQLIVNLPFALRMVRTAFIDVSPRMEFVAETLGAGPWAVFRTIIVPTCRNALISTFVLTWARGMGEFGATLMLVGVTRMKTETLPGSIYLSISTGNNDTAMATAMIMLLVSALTLVVANYLNRPVAANRLGDRAKRGKKEDEAARALKDAHASRCQEQHACSEVSFIEDAPKDACQIDIKGLQVRRGDFCLDGVNLSIAPREIFAILGRTGSGKTVLLESIGGAFALNEGEILWNGQSALDIPVQQRRMGIVYQEYALFPHMTVFENIAYGLKRHGFAAEEIEVRVNEMLDRFCIWHLRDKYPGVISGGESQRVALARALVLRPELLLLDEPFAALDPTTKKQMYQTVKDIHQAFGCTIIFVTHDFHEAQELADRVGIVLKGKLRVVLPASELLRHQHEADVAAFLGQEQAARI